jgi:transporter family-2 protein
VSSLVGSLALAILAAGAGVSFVMQQAVNANLRAVLGSAVWAGFISDLGGTLCMLLAAVAMRAQLPAFAVALRSSWCVNPPL